MKIKVLKISGIAVSCVVAAACIVYLIIAFYYQNKFLYGTYINSVSVKGMDTACVNDYLAQAYSDYMLVLDEGNEKEETISGSAVGFSADFTNELNEILNKQNILYWGYYFLYPVSYHIEPVYAYDEMKLNTVMKELDCFYLDTANRDATLEIKKEYLGYRLIDETTNVMDTETATGLIKDALDRGLASVSLADCYVPYTPTEDMQEVYALWKKIDKVQQSTIVFEDGDLERTLNVGVIGDWIVADQNDMPILDENGQIQLDPEKVAAFAGELAALFDTYGKDRLWHKKNGGTVWLQYSGSGYEVDQEAEIEKLTEDVLAGKTETRKPIYEREGSGRGKDEIGNTYIEIDMSAQKLYYFVDGRIKLTTDVVTGNTSRGHGTPAKICAIYAKQKNRVLRGPNYAAFVYYWMPVSGNIGIHDATWRDEFGGEIYKTDGSHGCINLPKEKAAKLYEMAEIGTPVILYY